LVYNLKPNGKSYEKQQNMGINPNYKVRGKEEKKATIE
jgi:hypothetical protein